jgi:hypothetical protein
MNSEVTEISTLKDNIVKIISLYEDLKLAYDLLLKQNKEVEKKLEIKEFEISEIKQQFETLKVAKTITSSSKDSHDAKIKINRIVREIDKCIGLLNK